MGSHYLTEGLIRSDSAQCFLDMMICCLLCGAVSFCFCEGLKGNVADSCLDLKVSVQKLAVLPYLQEESGCTRKAKRHIVRKKLSVRTG